ncbi:hypothetical protein [Moorella sp. ACPs]|uniref:hypothetical protein n=1 Tax=Neomoorella carbonis TaxID=3062783 RepID=UPI0032498D0C
MIKLQGIDWPKINARNRGCFVVEYDPQFPGGFYVRHKGTPYYLPATRHDIECLVENALASLGRHHGPLLISSKEDQILLASKQAKLFEALNDMQEEEWFQWLIWRMLSKTRINERVTSLQQIQPGDL